MLRRIIAGFALALGITFLIALPSHADTNRAPQIPEGGQSWCKGRWQLRGDLWSQNTRYTAWQAIHPAAMPFKMRVHHTSMLAYFYCVQPGPNKIMGKWVEDCWAFTLDDPEHFWFAGVLAKTRIMDSSDRWSDSGGHLIEDVDKRQHCERDDIPPAEEIDMRLERDPRWRHSTQIRLRGPDEEWVFWKGAGGGVWKFITPKHDIRLSKWSG